jgi:hypothetical protein
MARRMNGELFNLDRPLVSVPGWLRQLLEPPAVPNVANDLAQNRRVTRVTERPGPRRQAYVSAALEREELNVANAPVGERHNTICRSAYALARLDQLDGQTIKNVLGHAAIANGRTQEEVDTAVDSAFEKRGR